MLGPLLTTKLYFPPVRPALVPRLRLVERLQAGLKGPLTLISAPAGSGKTTLLSEWRAGPGAQVPLAWLSLDAGDNNPNRFFHHLAASLDPLQPGLLAGVLPLLQAPEPLSPEAILTPLINSLDGVSQDFILALDDYHVIETGSIHAGLIFLLDHLPVRMHVILLTRSDPPLPLSRLRARGHLAEIRAEHLRFDLTETAQFLNRVMGLEMTNQQVEALEQRTEGWVAGLQLAALSMQGREDVEGFVSAFTGSNHYIVDYLGEEVLNRQPEPLREFLLKSSLLDRLSGPLCDAVTGGENGSEILEGLERANLFVIPLDKDRCWYRFHHLFADLLRNRLSHSRPEILPKLHERASRWFEENGLIDEAIDHALAARDFENAARLFCSDSLQVLYNRPFTVLERWLQAFPESFLQQDPRLCLARAHLLWSIGRKDLIAPWNGWAQAALVAWEAANPEITTATEYLTLLGETYAFSSMLAQEDPGSAVELAQKAVSLIPKTARSRAFALRTLYKAYALQGETEKVIEVAYEAVALARELNYPSMLTASTYILCVFLRVKGKLHEAERVAKEDLEYAEDHGQAGLFYYGFPYITLAEIYYDWNELDEMEACLTKGLALIRPGGPSLFLLNGLGDLVLLYLARKEYEKAADTLAVMEHEYKDMERETVRPWVEITKLRWRAAQGDLSGLAGWIEKVDLSIQPKMDADRFSVLGLAASFLLKLDRLEEAWPILDGLAALAEQSGDAGLLIPMLVLQAVAWKKEKEPARALAVLEKALALAEKEGQIRPFLDEGSEMLGLLQTAHQRGILPHITARLLSAFAADSLRSAAAPSVAKTGLLSRREIELLELVASGCSNKDISNRLVISMGTVKRHTFNIFNKLDVKNRTEAVAKAREFGLL